MSRQNRFRLWAAKKRRSRHANRSFVSSSYARRLHVETLEDRRMLATFTVTNLLDGPVSAPADLPGSLRQAAYDSNNASGADVIEFNIPLPPLTTSLTLSLTDGAIELSEAVSIVGQGRDLLTIKPAGQLRVFEITATSGDFAISQLRLRGPGFQFGPLHGGAVYSQSAGELSVVDVEISEFDMQRVNAAGGAIYAVGSLRLERAIIRGNSINRGGGGGGGVYVEGNLAIVSSWFELNRAVSSIGGAVYVNGDLTVSDSVISFNNSTAGVGGGIAAFGSINIEGSTISGNSAAKNGINGGGEGGGLYIGSSLSDSVIVSHSTIANNIVAGHPVNEYVASGGGFFSSTSVEVTLDHTVVAGNMANIFDTSNGASTSLPDNVVGNFALDYALIDHTEDSGASQLTVVAGSQVLLDIDAKLGPLGINGGPLPSHVPLPASPLIDAGDPAFTSPPDFDQRGAPFSRSVDGSNDGTPRIDIGAVERIDISDVDNILVNGELVVSTTEDMINLDYSSGNLSLREAILLANARPGQDEIGFATNLDGSQLTLSAGEMLITGDTVISAEGLPSSITISGDKRSRIFMIDNGDGNSLIDVTLRGLTFKNGRFDITGSTTAPLSLRGGGAVFSREHLTVFDARFFWQRCLAGWCNLDG